MATDGTINLNISSTSPLIGGLPAADLTNDNSSSTDVRLVKKRVLTDAQRNDMNLLGMNPDDSAQIDLFLNMSAEDIQANKDALYANIDNNLNSAIEEKPQQEHVHNFQIDTDSPEWGNMSNKQRIQTFLENGAKAQYSEAEWATMKPAQRKNAIERFTEKELNEHVPGFSEMNETEQLQAGSEFLNLMNIADANNMSLKDLLALKKDSPEQFEQISNNYFESNAKINLVEDAQNRRMNITRRQFEDLQKGVENYAQSNDLTIDNANRAACTFAYLDEQIQNGTKLKGVKKDTYEALKTIRALNNGSLEEIKAGDKKITDLFEDPSVLKRDDEGNVQWEHPDNRTLITSKIAEQFANCKTDEERLELFQSYGVDSQTYIVSAFSHTDGNMSVKSILRGVGGGSQYMASVDGKSTDSDQNWYATDGLRGLHAHNNGTISEEGRKAIAETVQVLNAEPAALANVTAYELNDPDLAKDVTSAVGKREDARDVFEISNPLIADSENISYEMKQFYAQNSIEVLKSPEDRQSQADSLGKYNLDSFKQGVQKGYENIANGTASGSSSSSTQNNVTNPITNSSQNIQVVSQNIQNAQNVLASYSDNSVMPHAEAVKMFQRMEPAEQRQLLSSLSPQQVSQIPITVCNSFPELINTFIDLGKGVEIIQQCNVGTGNKTIQTMAKSKGTAKKQFNEWAANHLDRLAKCTYDDLVDSGAIKVNEHKAFSAKS